MLYSEKQFKSQSLQERTAYTKNVLKLLGETMNMDQRPQKQSGYKIDNIKALANGSHKDKEQYYDFVYDTQFRMALLTKPCNRDKIVRDETVQKDILDTLYFAVPFEDRLGMPPNWTDALRITLKQFMRTFQQFNVQDIVDYMAKHHPKEEYNKDTLYVQLFLLTILGHLRAYGKIQKITIYRKCELHSRAFH